jgi:hypothetical protein
VPLKSFSEVFERVLLDLREWRGVDEVDAEFDGEWAGIVKRCSCSVLLLVYHRRRYIRPQQDASRTRRTRRWSQTLGEEWKCPHKEQIGGE